jgi:hypothetical protein
VEARYQTSVARWSRRRRSALLRVFTLVSQVDSMDWQRQSD